MKSVKISSGDYEITLDDGSVWILSYDPEFKGAEKWLCHCKTNRGLSLDPMRTKRECLDELRSVK